MSNIKNSINLDDDNDMDAFEAYLRQEADEARALVEEFVAQLEGEKKNENQGTA